jgi:hypothetical protein
MTMPYQSHYQMAWRPESYWGIDERNRHIGASVKGELRRQVAKELAERGILDPVISQESLAQGERDAAGRVHPWFMGGEYLPDSLPSEVEIARVTLNSTLLDVISVRARRAGKRIAYRIVDEYEDLTGDYQVVPKTSSRPLTLAQLVRMIDRAQEYGLVGTARYFNYYWGDADPEQLYDFATVSSEFYDELGRWYDEANQEWLAAEQNRLREGRDWEEEA